MLVVRIRRLRRTVGSIYEEPFKSGVISLSGRTAFDAIGDEYASGKEYKFISLVKMPFPSLSIVLP
jgi:hypothetical protein